MTLEEYRGRVVLLEFWATWCGPCVGSMPRVKEIQARFTGDADFSVLAVHTDGSGDPAAMLGDLGVSVRLIPRGQEVARAYDVRSLPTYVVVGRDATIVDRYTGALTIQARDRLIAAVEGALGRSVRR